MPNHSKLVLKSTNELLDYFSQNSNVPSIFPTNKVLARKLNISTTTIQKVTTILCEKGIARKDGPNKILLRRPRFSDYYASKELENTKVDLIEKEFLRRLSNYDFKPGDRFSELNLSQSLKSNTVVVREALLKIAQSGIIKKHPRQKWEVVKFSRQMVEEISATRKLYECYALESLQKFPVTNIVWDSLQELKNQHTNLLKKKIKFEDLIVIEKAFHYTLVKTCHNRFIEKSYSSVFTLVHFHLWQIEYDQPKIVRVIQQHLDILEALLQKDFSHAMENLNIHLQHAELSMKEVNKDLEEEKN